MPPCRHFCDRSDFPYRTTKKPTYQGLIWCQSCRKSVECDLIKCPCCGIDFRRKPRHGRLKKEMLAQVKRY